METSWSDSSASGFQALVLLPGEICYWGFKSSKIFGNFLIALSPCFWSEVEICKQMGWKRSVSKLATNSLFPES